MQKRTSARNRDWGLRIANWQFWQMGGGSYGDSSIAKLQYLLMEKAPRGKGRERGGSIFLGGGISQGSPLSPKQPSIQHQHLPGTILQHSASAFFAPCTHMYMYHTHSHTYMYMHVHKHSHIDTHSHIHTHLCIHTLPHTHHTCTTSHTTSSHTHTTSHTHTLNVGSSLSSARWGQAEVWLQTGV